MAAEHVKGTKDIDVAASSNASCKDLNNISNLFDTGEQKAETFAVLNTGGQSGKWPKAPLTGPLAASVTFC